MDLSTDDGRERALDALGAWFGTALVAAAGDEDAASGVIAAAITAFYDIRESAEQLRGMYAGHFFFVDGVGLEASDRPVPWDHVRAHAPRAHLERYQELFDRLERIIP